jgi:arsenic resistance protein ArsH
VIADSAVLTHKPRILFLYGSLRQRSYSRLLAEEGARIISELGADVRIYDPFELPMCDSVPVDHPKVVELRALSEWSEGQVWSSPERHGAVTAVLKNQIDWLPLNSGAVRPTQGRTLAVMQVSGGSQSFNAVNSLRLLGRWMRMFTIPNQSSVPKAYEQFEEDGRMKDSSYRDRVVGLRCACPSSHRCAHAPTVILASAGSTYVPVTLAPSTLARNRSASIFRAKVLLRCEPAGVR